VPHELGPGIIRDLMAVVVTAAEEKTRLGLTEAALAREAKANLGKGGTHRYGTPTPASPGGPPALISGTLRRSVTHSPVVKGAFGWETRVGLAAGFYPPYPKNGNRTQSSRYGLALETGLRNGAKYPWLLPAFHAVVPQMRGINAKFLDHGWPHI
jgi:hypothetical protein